MKQRILQLSLLIAVMIMTQCSDDDKPKSIPDVTTAEVTEFTTTTATVGGEITDDGNAEITVTGIVYSSVVGEPTIADDKIELTDTKGDFSTVLEDLTSGTLYHVRAFATNSKGTGYGDVVDFTTGNAAPTATNISISGQVEVNKLLTATYTYTDSEGDAQAASTFQWYVADNGTGAGEVAIAGATALTYTVQAAQQSKFIRFGVTPKAGAGTLIGTEVKSTFVGAVGEATTVTFMYNGQEVTYGIINSPTVAGRKWLDRNLGAPNVATAVDNYQNYGDMFQWGRLADGHQLILRNGPNDADMTGVSGITSPDLPYEYSTTDVPVNSKLIIIPNGQLPGDWRDPQNNNLWQGVNGINNPCPAGWRIPTAAEWASENLTDLADGYAKLKLTYTGSRLNSGDFSSSTVAGNYYSSTIDPDDATKSMRARMNPTFNLFSTYRSTAVACRCIKN